MRRVAPDPNARTREGGEIAPRWGMGDVAVGLIPIYLGALAVLGGGADSSTPSMGALVAGAVFYWVFFLGVPALATRYKGNGLVTDLGLRPRRWDLPVGFVVGVFAQAVLVPLLYLPMFWLFPSLDDNDVTSDAKNLTDSAHGLGVLVLIVVVAVGAPIVEEIFFRGLLLRAVDRRAGQYIALVVSSVVFGLSHLEGIELPALIMFGLIAGYLAQRTGRLGASIGAHVGFNSWTLFVLLVLHW